ncbi:ComF family protein [Tenacibaculum sp. IB213877]|uniref:ComF family protein n=1 Tax=Tenacibaculum sp. IB213877 TaxID=3097351 RepID=UPI002A5ABCA6|nr:phosphoribosyltransferase family protein [Tenacibaculum sp. IB213877]MDY0780618.1 phosphoribosyltransferase family protein [Tenacibaculum sp. IB213877]
MQFLKDFTKLFYPELCVGCNSNLYSSELILCSSCRFDLPILDIEDPEKNLVASSFYGRIPIKHAVSLLSFQKENTTQKLIHHLKYKNNQEIGSFLGQWFRNHLKEKNFFSDIDYIIPVPLHPKKLQKRGYNQVTTFGKSLSKELEISYQENILQRVDLSSTQTLKKRFERFSNENTKFKLTNLTFFENKHVLLVDDVITTGATLEACCNELLKTKNITISIATMAFTEKT